MVKRVLCGRCGRPRARERVIAYNDTQYAIPACPAHYAEMSRLLYSWTRFGHEDFEGRPSGCDRCDGAVESMTSLVVDDEESLLFLCSTHADAVFRDVHAWSRDGRLVEPEVTRERPVRLQTGPGEIVHVPPPTRVVIVDDEELTDENAIRRLDALEYGSYYWPDATLLDVVQAGIPYHEALQALTEPTRSRKRGELEERTRGGITVTVQPRRRQVVAVRQLQGAVHASQG